MRYLLYYAGMMKDPTGNEQIGLATSSDGLHFERIHGDGLLLRRDEDVAWKNLRVCNPAVFPWKEGHALLYEAVGCPAGTHGVQQGLKTVIALATSRDGIAWDCTADPVLSWEDMARIDPEFDPARIAGVIEPAVLCADGRARMWFAYDHPSRTGNALFHAESSDLRRWEVCPAPTLVGSDLGAGLRVHYPQVLEVPGGLALWFTIKNSANQADGIFVASSTDGLKWSDVRQVFPRPRTSARIELVAPSPPQFHRLPGAPLRRVANSVARRLFWRMHEWRGTERRALFGYAHSHFVPDAHGQRMYFHYGNSAKGNPSTGRKWLDIGCMSLDRDGNVLDERVVFTPSPDPHAWDHVFVADPFVYIVD